MGKIQYENKVALLENADIPDINKVKADDMNEIKQVVNENDDKFLTNGLNVSNEVDEDYRVNLLKGKNLFDKNNFIKLDGIYISMSNGAIGSYQGNKTLVIQCNPSTTYTIQKISGATFRAGSYATYPSVGTNALTYQINSTGTTITITTGSTAKYLCVQYFGTDDTQTESTILNSIQIELGSTATSYEPYITPSINVDGEEIYSKGVITYSTSEINTGKKWINGKSIYRKVVQFNPSTSAMETKTAHNISNLSEILPTSSCIFHRTGNQFVPFSMFYPNTNQYLDWSMGWQVDSTHIFTWLGSSMRGQMDTSNYGAVAILEYTKTTDV